MRLSKRYSGAINRALGVRDNRSPMHEDHFIMPMSPEDRKKLGQWFTERYNYLQEIYREAINEDDNIIAGKQMVYDRRPRLGDQYPPDYVKPEFNVELPPR